MTLPQTAVLQEVLEDDHKDEEKEEAAWIIFVNISTIPSWNAGRPQFVRSLSFALLRALCIPMV